MFAVPNMARNQGEPQVPLSSQPGLGIAEQVHLTHSRTLAPWPPSPHSWFKRSLAGVQGGFQAHSDSEAPEAKGPRGRRRQACC